MITFTPQKSFAENVVINSKLICDTTSPGYPAILQKKGSKLTATTFKIALKQQATKIKKAKQKIKTLKRKKAKQPKISSASNAKQAAIDEKALIKACENETLAPRYPGPACVSKELPGRAARLCKSSIVSTDGPVLLIAQPTLSPLQQEAQAKIEASGVFGFSCVYSLDGRTNPLVTYSVYYTVGIGYETADSTYGFMNSFCNTRANVEQEDPFEGKNLSVDYDAQQQIYVYIFGKLGTETRRNVISDYVSYLREYVLPCSCKSK